MAEGKPIPPKGAETLDRQGTDMLVQTFHSDADPAIRRYAVYLLGKSGDPLALRPLVEALADPEKSVREQAMLSLVDSGRSAIAPLTDALAKDPKWEARYRAAEALGKLADEEVLMPLIRGLNDKRDHVRYMAAKGLMMLGDSRAIEPLIILLADENRVVRMMTARALSAIGGEQGHRALEAALSREKDEEVKNILREALQ
jgi:HEAT repeat protein